MCIRDRPNIDQDEISNSGLLEEQHAKIMKVRKQIEEPKVQSTSMVKAEFEQFLDSLDSSILFDKSDDQQEGMKAEEFSDDDFEELSDEEVEVSKMGKRKPSVAQQ
eukprot:TRINITY_DN1356_c0_g1_i1.p2 TRINITY_DN1356_c0_g1~~TRINITY_DN1356_c0_g1_i1.p2  ORF type:complete len:106 (-),score=19.76 TRINITY_DN1356_c0_g1_i1:122-439(-)